VDQPGPLSAADNPAAYISPYETRQFSVAAVFDALAMQYMTKPGP
jgi:hypothetical protein